MYFGNGVENRVTSDDTISVLSTHCCMFQFQQVVLHIN